LTGRSVAHFSFLLVWLVGSLVLYYVAVLDRNARVSKDGNYLVTWSGGTAWLHALRPSGFVASRVMDGIGEGGVCVFEGAFLWCKKSFDGAVRVFRYASAPVAEVSPESLRTAQDPKTGQACRVSTQNRASETVVRCVSNTGTEAAIPAPYALGVQGDPFLSSGFLYGSLNVGTNQRELVRFDPATSTQRTLFSSTCGPAAVFGTAVTSSRLFFSDCSGIYSR
jgi:hypothetical protein